MAFPNSPSAVAHISAIDNSDLCVILGFRFRKAAGFSAAFSLFWSSNRQTHKLLETDATC